jgi:hypothetical protein
MIVNEGKIGIVDYQVHDVLGDGHCFYRAIFNVLQEASDDTKEYLGIDGESDEDDGVEMIRMIVAGGLRDKELHNESRVTIDNLCALVDDSPADTKDSLREQLNEMYPFVTKSVCGKKDFSRYELVADMIEDMDTPMFASSLEVDQLKATLSRSNGANITILTINANGSLKSAEKRWQTDLIKLLENATSDTVVVILNVDNLHYQYLKLKAKEDNELHTILNRLQLLRLLSIGDIHDELTRMSLHGGNSKRKNRKIRRLRLTVV